VDYIKATRPDVTRVVAMTHIGYDADIELARNTRGVHLIAGGHSHTLLGDMDGAAGPYPTIETNLDDEEVFVVTAYRWGEYLGYIDVTFDQQGKIVEYAGGPVHLTNQTEQDAGLQAQILEWRKPFDAFAAEVIGYTAVNLSAYYILTTFSGNRSQLNAANTGCKSTECVLGGVMADAMVHYRGGEVAAGIVNGGGVRITIPTGNVTRGNVITAFPFGNAVADAHISGTDLWKVFEGVVSAQSQFNSRAVSLNSVLFFTGRYRPSFLCTFSR
jgi:2',3'-cyclic-nucleotide 2'-phosphodiesterase (5'-nucleotidase family)